MIRRIIVTSHRGHFDNAIGLWQSYEKFVIDKDLVNLSFVTSNLSEMKELYAFTRGRSNVSIYNLEDLLKADLNCPEYYKSNTFEKCAFVSNKHPYQAIKKSISLASLDYDQALLMDCDSIFIKPVNLSKHFDSFFEGPIVFYSNSNSFLSGIIEDSLHVIGEHNNKKLKSMWMFEYFGWFIDKKLFNSFEKHVQKIHNMSLIEAMMIKKGSPFEVISYHSFLKENNHPYKFVNIEDELQNCLGKDGIEIFRQKFDINNRCCGILEFLFRGYDKTLHSQFFSFLQQWKLCCIRLEKEMPIDANSLIKNLADSTHVCYLASSEAVSREFRQTL